MILKEVFEHFALNLLGARLNPPIVSEIFVPKEVYEQLQYQYQQIQRMPQQNKLGFDMGIEIGGVLKIKPLIELESMRKELLWMEERMMKLMALVQAQSESRLHSKKEMEK